MRPYKFVVYDDVHKILGCPVEHKLADWWWISYPELEIRSWFVTSRPEQYRKMLITIDPIVAVMPDTIDPIVAVMPESCIDDRWVLGTFYGRPAVRTLNGIMQAYNTLGYVGVKTV